MKWKVYRLKKRRSLRSYAGSARSFLYIGTWIAVLGFISFLLYFIYLERTIPDPQTLVARHVKESTKIYDRTGTVLLYDVYAEEKRTVIPWEDVPLSIKSATLAAEDSGFYEHKGFDIMGIFRSIYKDIISVSLSQGGSTITQQLIKKALLGDEKLWSRKIKEIILAIKIERTLTKDQIFWMYLNQIPYGSVIYGIEEASKTYFGKHTKELSIAQAALLASLVKAPSYYSPYGKHIPELLARKDFILQRMRELGYITDTEFASAVAEEISFQPPSAKMSAPHFAIMAREYLIQHYGQDAAESGGFRIFTTLDASMQKRAEDLVEKYAAINKAKYKAKNAALVSLDPRTGDILALVGSANYFDIENEGNFNVATANRQPGSAFKPFAYAAAFSKGYPDDTVLFDVRTEFNPYCSPDATQKKDKYGLDCYHPQNYDGTYRGPVTIRQSLAQSLNVPSVKVLYLAGIPETINLAQKMGITTLTDPSRFGLSLVLGGAEVRLVDIVSAYGVFANDGIYSPWSFISRIELADGTVLEKRPLTQTRVLEPYVTRLLSDVLSDNSARAAVFGTSNSLYFPDRPVAAKTGTTQENRDAWVIGYTPSLVTGVWVGNNDNTSMTQAGAGISAAGPLWHSFIAESLSGTPVEFFPKPDPVTTDKIMLNGNWGYYPFLGAPRETHSILFYVNKNDPLGPFPSVPSSDIQFENWEWAVRTRY